MLGIRTRDGRMEGTDESTELKRHPEALLAHFCRKEEIEIPISVSFDDNLYSERRRLFRETAHTLKLINRSQQTLMAFKMPPNTF